MQAEHGLGTVESVTVWRTKQFEETERTQLVSMRSANAKLIVALFAVVVLHFWQLLKGPLTAPSAQFGTGIHEETAQKGIPLREEVWE